MVDDVHVDRHPFALGEQLALGCEPYDSLNQVWAGGPGGQWTRTLLTKGDPAPWPKSGASDVAVGHLAKRRFLCSIEPWHGNQVVVYRQQGGAWRRQVLDASYVEGHTIQAASVERAIEQLVACLPEYLVLLSKRRRAEARRRTIED